MHTPSAVRIGDGDHKVIVLHGWLGDARSYEALWPVLDRDKFSYAFMDARGYGAGRGIKGEYSIAELAGDALQLADASGWDRFSLVGHSLGGMAAQRVLHDDARRVRAIAGVTPVAACGAQFDEAGWELFSGAVDDLDGRRQILRMLTGARLTDAWVERTVQESLERIEPTAMSAYLRSHVYDGFHEQVAGADLPMLVLLGEHDPGVTREVVERTWLEWFPNVAVETIGNASHYPMNETPIALVTSIERFLARA